MEPNKHGGDPSGSDPNNIPEQLRDRSSSSSQPWRGRSVLNANAVPYQYQPPGNALSSVNIWGPNPRGTPLPRPPAPSVNTVQPQPSGHGPPPGCAAIPPTVDPFRTLLLGGRRHLAVLMPPELAARVVDLLARGDQEVLHWAVDAATTDVYMLMRSETGPLMFAALLRACVRLSRNDLLHRIAMEVASRGGRGSGLLMDVANDPPGEQSLLELIRAINPHPDLCQMLITRLLGDGMMEHWKGPNLLRRFFSVLPPDYDSTFIQFANSNFVRLLSSEPGVGCLMACYMGARHRSPDLKLLEKTIVMNTSAIAQLGEYSNRLLRCVLERGRGRGRYGIANGVLKDLATLSTHQFGHLVVMACIQLTCVGSRDHEVLLRRTLAAFRALDINQLGAVVLNGYGSSVIRNLLLTGSGMQVLSRNAKSLAMRIMQLPVEVQQRADAELMELAAALLH
ncbi:hypothetical protein BS78_01G450300 [Paspalum vaginatum]|nr:hypothetical protein BS78_01G450300 [Paspalum vaginatum]